MHPVGLGWRCKGIEFHPCQMPEHMSYQLQYPLGSLPIGQISVATGTLFYRNPPNAGICVRQQQASESEGKAYASPRRHRMLRISAPSCVIYRHREELALQNAPLVRPIYGIHVVEVPESAVASRRAAEQPQELHLAVSQWSDIHLVTTLRVGVGYRLHVAAGCVIGPYAAPPCQPFRLRFWIPGRSALQHLVQRRVVATAAATGDHNLSTVSVTVPMTAVYSYRFRTMPTTQLCCSILLTRRPVPTAPGVAITARRRHKACVAGLECRQTAAGRCHSTSAAR